ncbi:hypothetical protein C4D60_Mb06t03420 [Musa balbisiana]|uniref:VQ domain-containing protein n=1 Tax=Musa balbisiana TaxID=52838 RepID=A0A4S8IL14_MUSBA|nr:hypothetical protein C4D60_Mb06t03420 [Musa balbisiana]
MDSAKSSSLQPSGGGDDEYGSPAAPLSAFFRSRTATSAAASLQPSPYYYGDHHFDSLDYLDSTRPFTSSPSTVTFSSSPPSAAVSHGAGAGASPAQQLPDQSNVAAATPAPERSSKKRCRASRRAPTTVLTTDASNFRAMVQELTGIQSFATSPSPCAGARLGLFHSTLPLPPVPTLTLLCRRHLSCSLAPSCRRSSLLPSFPSLLLPLLMLPPLLLL